MNNVELKALKRGSTLRLVVEDSIREAIFRGALHPGQRLVERKLCEMTGAGRTSVREALRQLEAEGLIISNPHKGPSVATLSAEEARQLYDVRALLESFAGQECARQGSDEQIADLVRAAGEFKRCALEYSNASGDDAGNDILRDQLIKAKTGFYRCLTSGSNNHFVIEMLTSLHNRITFLRTVSMTRPGRLEHSVAELDNIVLAIRERDPAKAGEACRHHIASSAKVALAHLADA